LKSKLLDVNAYWRHHRSTVAAAALIVRFLNNYDSYENSLEITSLCWEWSWLFLLLAPFRL
jgi:hypothetical protein